MSSFPAKFVDMTVDRNAFDHTGAQPPVARMVIELPSQFTEQPEPGSSPPYTDRKIDPQTLAKIQNEVMRRYGSVARQQLNAFRQDVDLGSNMINFRSTLLAAGIGMKYAAQFGNELVTITVSAAAVMLLMGGSSDCMLVLYGDNNVAAIPMSALKPAVEKGAPLSTVFKGTKKTGTFKFSKVNQMRDQSGVDIIVSPIKIDTLDQKTTNYISLADFSTSIDTGLEKYWNPLLTAGDGNIYTSTAVYSYDKSAKSKLSKKADTEPKNIPGYITLKGEYVYYGYGLGPGNGPVDTTVVRYPPTWYNDWRNAQLASITGLTAASVEFDIIDWKHQPSLSFDRKTYTTGTNYDATVGVSIEIPKDDVVQSASPSKYSKQSPLLISKGARNSQTFIASTLVAFIRGATSVSPPRVLLDTATDALGRPYVCYKRPYAANGHFTGYEIYDGIQYMNDDFIAATGITTTPAVVKIDTSGSGVPSALFQNYPGLGGTVIATYYEDKPNFANIDTRGVYGSHAAFPNAYNGEPYIEVQRIVDITLPDGSLGSKPEGVKVITPYKTFNRTDAFFPWLNLTDGSFVIQGFGFGPFSLASDAEPDEKFVYCNGVDITSKIVSALNLSDSKSLKAIFIHVPTNKISGALK